MRLASLLLSRDEDLVRLLEDVLRRLEVEPEVCGDLQPAVERLAQATVSLIVVDYDVEHATELLKLVRQHYAGNCVALAVLKGLASIQAAYDMGANFVLIKPVPPDAASHSLADAIALVRRMQQRPARLVVPTLAYVRFKGAHDPAIILDISEGGMAIQALQRVDATGPLQLRFDLPGVEDNLEVAAEIIWADSSGRAGLRFKNLAEDTKCQIQEWMHLNGPHRPATHAPSPLEETEKRSEPAIAEHRREAITVAQRVFSTLIDAGVVLLATLVFLATFLVCTRQLPFSYWTLPVTLIAPFVFWIFYLCLFLRHPRGTVGMQMAENGTAVGSQPEMFDRHPPSRTVSASARVLTWMEGYRGAAPRNSPADAAVAAHAVTPRAAEADRGGNQHA
jgi:CheY-like chemotaxis protein